MNTQFRILVLLMALFVSKVDLVSALTPTNSLTPTFSSLYLGAIQPFKMSALAMDGYYSNSILSFMHSHNNEVSVAFSASNYDRAQVQILINSGHAVGASSIKVYGPNGNIVSVANQSYCQIQPAGYSDLQWCIAAFNVPLSASGNHYILPAGQYRVKLTYPNGTYRISNIQVRLNLGW